MAIAVNELLGAPFACGFIITFVPDLEPTVSGGCVRDGGGDFLQIDSTRSLVRDVDAAFAGIMPAVWEVKILLNCQWMAVPDCIVLNFARIKDDD